jgi:hypothetical protein
MMFLSPFAAENSVEEVDDVSRTAFSGFRFLKKQFKSEAEPHLKAKSGLFLLLFFINKE